MRQSCKEYSLARFMTKLTRRTAPPKVQPHQCTNPPNGMCSQRDPPTHGGGADVRALRRWRQSAPAHSHASRDASGTVAVAGSRPPGQPRRAGTTIPAGAGRRAASNIAARAVRTAIPARLIGAWSKRKCSRHVRMGSRWSRLLKTSPTKEFQYERSGPVWILGF